MDFIQIAKSLRDMGISTAPLAGDTKLPITRWKKWQENLPTDEEIDKEFKNCGGLAAITGDISKLFLFDFDLKKQLPHQDYWQDFISQVPEDLKAKMLINATKNGGFHIWVRTDYKDKSRRFTRRESTIPELYDKYNREIFKGVEPLKASASILKAPYEVVIESRGNKSYGVIAHPTYQRIQGKKIEWFTIEEVELLVDICYSLDYGFIKEYKYEGKPGEYRTISQYNEDTTAEEVLTMVTTSGGFSFAGTDYDGNYKILRNGSNAKSSGYIYKNTGILHLFSPSSIFGDQQTLSPFSVFMLTNNIDKNKALKLINSQK